MYKTIECDGKKFNLIPVDSGELSIMTIGSNYLIRTVTHIQVGRFAGFKHEGTAAFAIMQDCSWVADTGRFNEALKKGKTSLNEVEWVANLVVPVNLNAVIEIWPWAGDLPMETK